jgi:hypothetical protein
MFIFFSKEICWKNGNFAKDFDGFVKSLKSASSVIKGSGLGWPEGSPKGIRECDQ